MRNSADGDRLRSQAAGELVPAVVDVTDAVAIRAAAAQVEAAVGEAGLAGVVCNAGIIVPGPLELLPTSEFRRQLEVNVLGTHAVAVAALPLLRLARGRIVIVGSISGLVAPPFFGPMLHRSTRWKPWRMFLRMELCRWQIAVSIIEPDFVATPLWGNSTRPSPSLASSAAPRRRNGTSPNSARCARRAADGKEGRLDVEGSPGSSARLVRSTSEGPLPHWDSHAMAVRWAAYHLPVSVLESVPGKSMGLR